MRSGHRETGRQSSAGEDLRREPTLGPQKSSEMQSNASSNTKLNTKPNTSNGMPDASQGVRFFTTQGMPLEKDVLPPLSILPNAGPQTASSPASHHDMDAIHRNGHAGHNGAVDGHPPFMPGMQPYMASPTDPAAGIFPHATEQGFPGDQTTIGKSSTSLHAALIVAIMAAGLAIGLIRTIWINDEREAKSVQEILANRMPLPPVTPESSGSKPSQDTPPQVSPAEPTEKETLASLPPGPESQEGMSENDPVKTGGQLSSALSMPEEIEESDKEEKPNAGETPPAEIKEATPAPPPAKTAAQTEKTQPEKKRKSRSEHKSRKLAESSKKDRIKEIDRVRTQAFSESSKDRVGKSRSSSSTENRIGPQSQNRKSDRTSQVAQRTVTSSEYARCERNSSIIGRERCKWELCNHKWGKGGCPSFKPEKSYIF